MAPNNVSSARWHPQYPGCFGFSFVQWEGVATHHPSFSPDFGMGHEEQVIIGWTCIMHFESIMLDLIHPLFFKKEKKVL